MSAGALLNIDTVILSSIPRKNSIKIILNGITFMYEPDRRVYYVYNSRDKSITDIKRFLLAFSCELLHTASLGAVLYGMEVEILTM